MSYLPIWLQLSAARKLISERLNVDYFHNEVHTQFHGALQDDKLSAYNENDQPISAEIWKRIDSANVSNNPIYDSLTQTRHFNLRIKRDDIDKIWPSASNQSQIFPIPQPTEQDDGISNSTQLSDWIFENYGEQDPPTNKLDISDKAFTAEKQGKLEKFTITNFNVAYSLVFDTKKRRPKSGWPLKEPYKSRLATRSK